MIILMAGGSQKCPGCGWEACTCGTRGTWHLKMTIRDDVTNSTASIPYRDNGTASDIVRSGYGTFNVDEKLEAEKQKKAKRMTFTKNFRDKRPKKEWEK